MNKRQHKRRIARAIGMYILNGNLSESAIVFGGFDDEEEFSAADRERAHAALDELGEELLMRGADPE